MGLLHNANPHRTLNGIRYQEPAVFDLTARGHDVGFTRLGNDHERRASVTSIQKVRLMEARRIVRQYPEPIVRELSPFELGMTGRKPKDNPFEEWSPDYFEWIDGYESHVQ